MYAGAIFIYEAHCRCTILAAGEVAERGAAETIFNPKVDHIISAAHEVESQDRRRPAFPLSRLLPASTVPALDFIREKKVSAAEKRKRKREATINKARYVCNGEEAGEQSTRSEKRRVHGVEQGTQRKNRDGDREPEDIEGKHSTHEGERFQYSDSKTIF